jgi:hypothetical protein
MTEEFRGIEQRLERLKKSLTKLENVVNKNSMKEKYIDFF